MRTSWRQAVLVAAGLVTIGLVTIGLTAGLVPPAGAQEPTPYVVRATPEDPESMALRVEDGAIRLTLEETIELALARNLGLVGQRYRRVQAHLGLEAAGTLYDWSLGSSLQASERTTPTISDLDGAPIQQSESQSFSLGLGRLLPTGATVSLDWSSSRASTNSVFSTFDPSYASGIGLRLDQPLLRGRGRALTEQFLRLARLDEATSADSFELSVTGVVSDAIGSYWELVGAVEQLEVAERGLESGRQLLEQSRLKVEGGLIPPLELVQSEFGLSTREEEVIRARAAVDTAADSLRRLLGVRDRRDWLLPVVPETRPELEDFDLELEDAVTLALAERPELRQQRRSLETLEIAAYAARRDLAPQLDLSVSYGLSGIGGTVLERDFTSGEVLSTVPGGLEDALQQILDREYDNWTVGLRFAYPLGNRAAEIARSRAELDLESARLALRDLEVQILAEVHLSMRSLASARLAWESAQRSTRLSESNLEAEQLRYENGRSTSFRVVDVQDDVNAARSREVTALTRYRRAQAEVYRAVGRLLEEVGVEIVGS